MNIVALILMIVGALNWLLVGLFNFNLVTAIFGAGSVMSIILYILVGLGGIWGIVMLFQRNVRHTSFMHDDEA
ncbi:MAG: DUF378 domain-containing protein [Clostridia bacterium]|jgi:uncharacterized membrane protein YuzA (DUF378 family)|nr:DUF378 domain-containing protein [Clostridia bacterium]MDO4835592.1 DUF378 domain-containing protein [Clostridia bacterium]